LPRSMMFKHSIKDNEQFTHTSSKGNLLGFTCGQQLLIGGTYDRVMTAGYQCSHIEGGTDTGAATPNCTFPAQGTTIPVERSYSLPTSLIGSGGLIIDSGFICCLLLVLVIVSSSYLTFSPSKELSRIA